MSQRVLVTGGAGFIGSHLFEALLAGGWGVSVLDNFDEFYDPGIKLRNLQKCQADKRFRLVRGDIRKQGDVEEAIGEGVEALVHLAARAGVRFSIEQPLLYQDVNVAGTAMLLEAARRHKVRKFIFAGSSSVYGNNRKLPFSETDNVDHPISPYAATKKAGELLCHAYYHLFGVNVTCLRFFTVYGPRQRPDLAIHKFCQAIEAGRPITMFGDGSMQRDYTYIDDIIQGVVAAIDRCQGYHLYNLGESRPVMLRDLIAQIEAILGKKAIIQRLPMQPGDMDSTYADITLAQKELAYRPATDIRRGLEYFVQWLRSGQAG